MTVRFELDGRSVEAPDDDVSLLEALRTSLGVRSAKDGCAPQGQCGCCTVLVDGAPRVACVTPVRRVAGRSVTTVDGLPPADRDRWAEAFCAAGASQCGFCTPGIILRLHAESARPRPDPERALLAHVCRCTGWRTILDATATASETGVAAPRAARDLAAASARAELEGGVHQEVGAHVALGRAPFAEDLAPADALVAVRSADGAWVVRETLAAARAAAGIVPGRRSTLDTGHPVAVPEGSWPLTLQTSWVDPGYLELDASWARPEGGAASPLGNGGAFGAKTSSLVTGVAERLAGEHGRPVRVVLSREDSVRLGPKRPPLAAGVDPAARRVVVHVARTEGIVARLVDGLGPDLSVEVIEVDVAGPPTSTALRAAGWAEGVALRSAVFGSPEWVTQPGGGRAAVAVGDDGALSVTVEAGDPLDETVLRSYCIGAAHMALSWVTSERLGVDPDGELVDLTVRSFGILRAQDTPPIEVDIRPAPAGAAPVAVSDAVFAATAAAVWAQRGYAPSWPTGPAVR